MLTHAQIDEANKLIRQAQNLYFRSQRGEYFLSTIDPLEAEKLQTEFFQVHNALRQLAGEDGPDAEAIIDAIYRLTTN